MPLVPFNGETPRIGQNVFIAPNAWITGNVSIGDNSSLFFGSVIRGDIQRVFVGKGTNIQEHGLIHTSHGLQDCIVGDGVTVGHGAIIHGCTVKDNCIIGMGSVILDGAEIGEESIVGAHSLITMNTSLPPRSLILGAPAKVVRPLNDNEIEGIYSSSKSYIEVATQYATYFNNAV